MLLLSNCLPCDFTVPCLSAPRSLLYWGPLWLKLVTSNSSKQVSFPGRTSLLDPDDDLETLISSIEERHLRLDNSTVKLKQLPEEASDDEGVARDCFSTPSVWSVFKIGAKSDFLFRENTCRKIISLKIDSFRETRDHFRKKSDRFFPFLAKKKFALLLTRA